MKARQVGWTTTLAREAVVVAAVDGDTTIIGSRSERQARELMRRAKLLLPIALYDTGLSQVVDRADEVELSNGGRIISVPANPDSITGFSGHVVLDEFARHKDADAIWEALFPSISQSKHLRVSVVSTPMGRAGQFYRIIREAQKGGSTPWSLHQVNIHQAVANGCGHDIEELRAGCLNEQVFRQSYLCEFLDESYALLPYDLLTACVDDSLSYEPDATAIQKSGHLFLGMDIAREHNLAVIAIVEQLGKRFICRGFIEMRSTSYDAQERTLYEYMDRRNVHKVCIDKTGLGDQFAERAGNRSHKAEGVHMTMPIKAELAALVRRVFDQGLIDIPDDDKLLADLHSVAVETTAAGNVRYTAKEAAGSHADRYTALSLALHAAVQPSSGIEQIVKGGKRVRTSKVGAW